MPALRDACSRPVPQHRRSPSGCRSELPATCCYRSPGASRGSSRSCLRPSRSAGACVGVVVVAPVVALPPSWLAPSSSWRASSTFPVWCSRRWWSSTRGGRRASRRRRQRVVVAPVVVVGLAVVVVVHRRRVVARVVVVGRRRRRRALGRRGRRPPSWSSSWHRRHSAPPLFASISMFGLPLLPCGWRRRACWSFVVRAVRARPTASRARPIRGRPGRSTPRSQSGMMIDRCCPPWRTTSRRTAVPMRACRSTRSREAAAARPRGSNVGAVRLLQRKRHADRLSLAALRPGNVPVRGHLVARIQPADGPVFAQRRLRWSRSALRRPGPPDRGPRRTRGP